MSQTIVRMPPSPTGHLHLGTARTALFNWLFAKKTKGKIIFRWEDTDQERSKTEYETEILEGLKWLGMDFEAESDVFERQTDLVENHKTQLEILKKKKLVFRCFQTKEQIEAYQEERKAQKKDYVFWSADRDLSEEESETRANNGEAFIWRFKTPQGESVTFQDEVRGEVTVKAITIGDFGVGRLDGSILYLLANVSDDLLGNVTHIIRGEDHIANTPKQVLIYQGLEKSCPVFAHIPLVIDSQKRKLSKRNTDPSIAVLISDFQAKGFLPQGVINGLAFLGWNPKTTDEFFSLSQLEEAFELKNVNKAAGQYDFEKMLWFNHHWIKTIDEDELIEYFLNWIKSYHPEQLEKYQADDKIKKIIPFLKEKCQTFAQINEETDYFYSYSTPSLDLLVKEKMKVDESLVKKVLTKACEALDKMPEEEFLAPNIKQKCVELIAEMELKNGQFLWPLRMALSGKEKSIGGFDLAEIIGKQETLKRINACLSLCA